MKGDDEEYVKSCLAVIYIYSVSVLYICEDSICKEYAFLVWWVLLWSARRCGDVGEKAKGTGKG